MNTIHQDEARDIGSNIVDVSKRVGQRLLDIGQNRVELLMLEAQEERERLVRVILLASASVAFGLLTGIAFTIGIVVAFWERSPLFGLAVLTPIYALVTLVLVYRLKHLRKDWHAFPATLEQLRKDCQCLTNEMH